MKKIIFSSIISLLATHCLAQSNTFPETGNVGIGAAGLVEKLTVGEYGGAIAIKDRTTMVSGTSSSGRLKFYDYGGEAANIALEHNYYFGSSPRAMLFSVNGSERLRITSSGNVGIGTINPLSALDVNGTLTLTTGLDGKFMHINYPGWGNSGLFEATSRGDIHFRAYSPNFVKDQLFLQHDGNVGIGTTNPLTALDVRGALTLTNPIIYTGASQTSHTYVQLINSLEDQSASGLKAGGVLISDTYAYANPGLNDLVVKGNVGIGTPTPTEKLSVNGKIRAKEIKVEAANWPDYVFKEDYLLPTLEETEKHIKEKGHLPGLPTAKEAETNGVDLGEMNKLLLKKVEELTLHLIQKDKKIEEQGKRIKQIEKILQIK